MIGHSRRSAGHVVHARTIRLQATQTGGETHGFHLVGLADFQPVDGPVGIDGVRVFELQIQQAVGSDGDVERAHVILAGSRADIHQFDRAVSGNLYVISRGNRIAERDVDGIGFAPLKFHAERARPGLTLLAILAEFRLRAGLAP